MGRLIGGDCFEQIVTDDNRSMEFLSGLFRVLLSVTLSTFQTTPPEAELGAGEHYIEEVSWIIEIC